ncbi:protein phosphatase CheZ [uncultured Rhodospira sp.]|uniref:protein phosphatase CheZ n=1 Tax=uncultured Rhodospira sp. TaxID=1936189 RepID=UPI00262756E9|nr:protein phosphatase CheZ [uncultured Rhodospira sp.]
MNSGQGAAGRSMRKRTFSIEKHLRREHDAELVFDLGAAPDSGGLETLINEVRAMRAEMADLRREFAEIKAVPSPPPPASEPAPARHGDEGGSADEAQLLRVEVARMVRSLATAKREIAEIKHPLRDADDDRMTRAASELDAIITATEEATHAILDAGEAITIHCTDILAEVGEEDAIAPRINQVSDNVARILEACNFQDITGQRISKVVKTLEFIEDRIRAIVEDWGPDAFLDLPLPDEDEAVHEDDESHLLNGPQLQNKGLSQDDIDALFG